ncbi:MAG: hypothetical protein ACREXY_02150 [Gammaproteobacteria bacterium]
MICMCYFRFSANLSKAWLDTHSQTSRKDPPPTPTGRPRAAELLGGELDPEHRHRQLTRDRAPGCGEPARPPRPNPHPRRPHILYHTEHWPTMAQLGAHLLPGKLRVLAQFRLAWHPLIDS